MHHLGVNLFINFMKKILILTILGLIWCSSSYSEIYIFYKQYINKLKEIELDYKQCLKSENIIICNKVIQEHKKIKSHTKFNGCKYRFNKFIIQREFLINLLNIISLI